MSRSRSRLGYYNYLTFLGKQNTQTHNRVWVLILNKSQICLSPMQLEEDRDDDDGEEEKEGQAVRQDRFVAQYHQSQLERKEEEEKRNEGKVEKKNSCSIL